jgi:hypothetical protein
MKLFVFSPFEKKKEQGDRKTLWLRMVKSEDKSTQLKLMARINISR